MKLPLAIYLKKNDVVAENVIIHQIFPYILLSIFRNLLSLKTKTDYAGYKFEQCKHYKRRNRREGTRSEV